MKASVHISSFLGEHALILCAGAYTATLLPSLGGNLIEFRQTERSFSFLRTPKSREELLDHSQFFGIPILFPPNRIAGGSFFREGKLHQMPLNSRDGRHYIHGIVRRLPWVVEDCAADGEHAYAQLRTELAEDGEMYGYFPYKASLTLRYDLCGTGVTQILCVRSRSDINMPVGIGQHTALAVPFAAGSSEEDCRLVLPAAHRWELDGDMLLTQRRLGLSPEETVLTEQGLPPLQKAYPTTHFARRAGNHVRLIDLKENCALHYELDEGYRHLVLWNHGGRMGYVCPEPMTWMINAPNLSLPDEVSGYRALPPGEAWTLQTKLCLREGVYV